MLTLKEIAEKHGVKEGSLSARLVRIGKEGIKKLGLTPSLTLGETGQPMRVWSSAQGKLFSKYLKDNPIGKAGWQKGRARK